MNDDFCLLTECSYNRYRMCNLKYQDEEFKTDISLCSINEWLKKEKKDMKNINKIKFGKGNKYDNDKLRYDLLSFDAIKGLVEILTMGAKKYGVRNWEKGIEWSRIFAATLRHLFAWWNGEDIDVESGKKHIHHVACNIHFLQHYSIKKIGKDDRPKKDLFFK